MKTYLTINNRRYEAKEFDFNLICDLSDMGIDFDQMRKAPASTIRAYASLCMDVDKDTAGEELQAHIIGGGKLDDIAEIMMDMIGQSDFFQALSPNEETSTRAKKTKKAEEK